MSSYVPAALIRNRWTGWAKKMAIFAYYQDINHADIVGQKIRFFQR